MKSFNFKDFISNEETPLTTRKGWEVRYLTTVNNIFRHVIVVSNDDGSEQVISVDNRGRRVGMTDPFIFFKFRTQIINEIECPLPFIPKVGEAYYLPSVASGEKFIRTYNEGSKADVNLIGSGMAFRSEEDARRVYFALYSGLEKPQGMI